uniref:Uncharacterized protein n=1 Tax=Ralstonia pickettii (strain 12D) TaxID=428406 RepID=C6BBU4_RALP1
MRDIRCVDCDKFSLQHDPVAARMGHGKCSEEKLPHVRYKALLKKQCKQFAPAIEHVADARAEWLKKKGIV